MMCDLGMIGVGLVGTALSTRLLAALVIQVASLSLKQGRRSRWNARLKRVEASQGRATMEAR